MRDTKEIEQFNQAMDTILRADPRAVKAAMEAEKKASAEKRKAEYMIALAKDIPQGLNRLRKNSRLRVKSPKSVSPGLKPALILMALCGG